ncbi:MAG: hypothetical protein RIT28_4262 [Pseudomonadota bacterium]|jgi:hypothetical protein
MAQPARKARPVVPEPRGDAPERLREYDERKAHPEPTIPHDEVKRLLGF